MLNCYYMSGGETMNNIRYLVEKIMNFVSVLVGYDYSTGHEDTLKEHPELGARWS
jgi:hypothetical protein